VAIEPKAFDVLAYLLHHPGRVVPKDELLDKLWPGQVVSETAMAHAVLAQLYVWKRQHAEAIAEAERAVAVGPNIADGAAMLATVLNMTDRPEEAIKITAGETDLACERSGSIRTRPCHAAQSGAEVRASGQLSAVCSTPVSEL
jgi:hypothetical protein